MDDASNRSRPALRLPATVVVMGVSGSGKTLVGAAIAESAKARFLEGDQFHPAANIERMAGGLPLRDEDRWAWLDAIAAAITGGIADTQQLVVACSALKRKYRDRLRLADPRTLFVYLDIGRDMAATRVAARPHHFMPASLVDSQFGDLEAPADNENALRLDAGAPLADVVTAALAGIAKAGQADIATTSGRSGGT